MLLASRFGTIGSSGKAEISAIVTDSLGGSISYDGTTWTRVAYGTSIGSDARGAIIGDLGLIFLGTASSEGRFSADGTSYSNVSVTASSVTNAGLANRNATVYAWSAGYTPFTNVPLVLYSTNPGVSWSADNPSGAGYGYDIMWDGAKWIVCVNDSSPNALQYKTTLGTGSWTTVTTPFASARQIAHNGTTYIIANNSTNVYTTTNLSTFTTRAVGATVDMIVTNRKGTWLAAQLNTTAVYRSTNDGVGWALSYTAPAAIRGLSYSANLDKFLMSSTLGNVRTSTDGSTWTTYNVGTTNTLDGIAGR